MKKLLLILLAGILFLPSSAEARSRHHGHRRHSRHSYVYVPAPVIYTGNHYSQPTDCGYTYIDGKYPAKNLDCNSYRPRYENAPVYYRSERTYIGYPGYRTY